MKWVQKNKGWDGYREAQNWDGDVPDTPEDDDVVVCVLGLGFTYTAGTRCPQKESKI